MTAPAAHAAPAAANAAPAPCASARAPESAARCSAPCHHPELARTHAASAAGVSEHLAVLRRAGLVSGRREGRTVRYSRTAAGDALLTAAR